MSNPDRFIRDLGHADRRAMVWALSEMFHRMSEPPVLRKNIASLLESIRFWTKHPDSDRGRIIAGKGRPDVAMSPQERGITALAQLCTGQSYLPLDSVIHWLCGVADQEEAARCTRELQKVEWPRVQVLPYKVLGAPEPIQVAWDLVNTATPSGSHTMYDLVTAHMVATRMLGQPWRDSLVRPIAERLTPENVEHACVTAGWTRGVAVRLYLIRRLEDRPT